MSIGTAARMALAAGAATLAAVLPAATAQAAFPGRNGSIAFALDNSDRDGLGQIVTTSVTGRGQRRIYSEGFGGSGQLAPRYSPDGRSILFQTDGQGPLAPDLSGADLETMAGDGSGLALVPGQSAAPGGTAPAWSPDGHSVVYAASGNLWIDDLATGTARQLTHAGATDPDWSSRNQIVYVHRRDLYLISPTGGPAHRVTFTGGVEPSFFPGGGRLAFVRPVHGVDQIFAIDLTGHHLRKLTDRKLASFSPAVAPDGRSIVFVHNDGAQENGPSDHIWVMGSDGSDAHQIPHLPGSDFGLVQETHPDWQPLPG